MNFKCLLGHAWKVVAFMNFKTMDGYHSNLGTFQCKKCGKLKVFINYEGGFIDPKKLNEKEK